MGLKKEKHNLLGLSVELINKSDFYTCLENPNRFDILCTVNAQFVVLAHETPAFKTILEENLCCIDGSINYQLHKMFTTSPITDKISGSDLVFDIMSYLKQHDKRIFIVGGMPEANNNAVSKVNALGVACDGYSPPYGPAPDSAEFNDPILEKIQQFRPDLIYSCLGAFKQELWLSHNKTRLQELGCSIGIGLGGTVNLLSGQQKRCPKLIKKLCLESIYRLLQEPKLFRVARILYSLKVFRHINFLHQFKR